MAELRRGSARHLAEVPAGREAPSSQAGAGFRWLAVLVAAALSCAISALAEWRLEQLVSAADPAQPLTWSALRFWLVAGVVFLAVGPLSVWLVGGGVARTIGRVRADGWRNGKPLVTALAIAACAGGVGWLLGILAAIAQANGSDWRYSFAGMVILAAIALGCLLWQTIRERAEWGYLICALAVGLVLVAIMPAQPNASWDGAIHFNTANFSYDPWLIAMLGFATCRYVGELQRPEEPLGFGHAAAILVPIVLACLVKAIYFPMALGFWALGRGKFLPGRQGLRWVWRLALVLVALGLFASFALPFLSKGGEGFTDIRGGEDVNSKAQFELVLEDPLVFVGAAGSTGLSIAGPAYLGKSVGLLPYMPPSYFEGAMGLVYFAFVTCAALLLRTEEDRPYAKVRFKALILTGMLGSYLLFAASLYIGFSAVGATEVAGFQPKYLLPFYPALFGIVLCFPGIAKAIGPEAGRLLRKIFWVCLALYFIAFIVLRFVVFFE